MTTALPVIAGLATGIAFVVIFATLTPFSPTSNVGQKQHLVDLTISGLKTTYRAGEVIIFSVNQRGGGCAFPDVWIENATGEKVWSANNPTGMLMCPIVKDEKNFQMTWRPDIIGDYPSINATDHYFVVAKFDDDSIRQGFRVN